MKTMEPIDRIAELRRQIKYEQSEMEGCKIECCQDCVDAKFGLDMAQGELDFLLAVKGEPVGILQHPQYNAAREWYITTQVK